MSEAGKHLLVVEDDPGLQSQLRWCFDDYELNICGNRDDAIAQVRKQPPGVVLLDLGLPPDPGGVTEGFATLKEIISLSPSSKVIVVTGDHDRENAVKAIALGAYDFYQKPVDPELLNLMVGRAYSVHELEEENRRFQLQQNDLPLKGVIASSPQMFKLCRTIEKVAPSDLTTLLLGASGTGKEVFARALHDLSPRAKQKMVAINCAAIPENLLESELFGYEKGAFTGANKQTPGKIEYANGGTLFLDEIGDLPLELQAKLLRFIQERVIERVGGRTEIPVDVRIICATHQDLSTYITDGRFREDLFYRISDITINIPPLKDREGDALVLARAFLNRFSKENSRPLKGFSPEAIKAIEDYDWPGNVRELESRIKRAVIMADNSYITPEDLEISESETEKQPLNLREVRDEAERKAILRALNHADHNISEAAKHLGVTRPTLYNMLEKYNLK
ncbi:MAG: PEP-CTERM-box response regulator transcription factor [Gammaproteobacteria bacterium]|uniref:PEP-CTERM-box response regulator transcription factor n=1 Tax=Pseudomaricurvus alcaniphilus TaxID=1166482 RepID=UPI00140D91B5|nr:PEP-CTERM-box response regulator transcription factor [Pseudomaricurvus alcaniphilus]MBR9912423.1 PEP-CTERM-box response regulator transcription factor [Gammaproteobacteria bacterium]NHN36744.1 PEP-CTERM-box response regulator transcription factor [Pseudomaricurvus alcaniphilus]